MNEIQSVKIQGNGYLLNGSMSVPKADGNREYEAIKQWLAEGNTPEPEFTEEEILLQEQSKFRQERDKLLSEADILINKAFDADEDTTKLKAYRQALRDATILWVMPSLADYL